MCQFFETIKVKDGKMPLLDYHSARMNYTRSKNFSSNDFIDLNSEIIIPTENKLGLYKCKVIYNQEIVSINFEPYEISDHKEVKIIENNEINYPFKSTDRSQFTEIMNENKEFSDVIILKNNEVTDAIYSNVVLFKNNQWFTPKTFLLRGTKRQFLIDQGLLMEKTIKKNDIRNFEKIAFINAMRDFEKTYIFEQAGSVLKLKIE